jgi:hypothetical protein
VKIRSSWLWILALLLPLLTVAGTVALYRHGPLVWQLYILYSLNLLTHPLILMFLILTVSTLGVVMVMRHRHRTELLAFGFLLSAVLHLLTVSCFSLWIVDRPTLEMSDDGERYEIAAGPQSFSESAVGEDLRSMLQEVSATDARELDSHTQTERANEPSPVHKPADLDLPERASTKPDRQQIEAAESELKQAVEALLESLPTPSPHRDATKLVQLESIETEEAPREPESLPEPTIEITQAEDPFKPSEKPMETPEAPTPNKSPVDHERETVELVSDLVAELRVEEALEKSTPEQAVDDLAMEAIQAETTPEDVPATVDPTERDVSDALQHQLQQAAAEVHSEVAPPEVVNPETVASAKMRHELPLINPYSRDVAQTAAQALETFTDKLSLNIADERELLPTEDSPRRDQEPEPEPRDLTTGRVDDRQQDSTPQMHKPTVDMPDREYAPRAASVTAESIQARQSQTVADALTSQRMDPRHDAPALAIQGNMTPLPAPRESEIAPATVDPTERDVSDALQHQLQQAAAEVHSEVAPPEVVNPETVASSKMRHALPSINPYSRDDVAEIAAQALETFTDKLSLNIADERELLPTEDSPRRDQEPEPEPRALTTGRVAERQRDSTPQVHKPTVDMPDREYAPRAASVTAESIQARQSQTVADTLTPQPKGPRHDAPSLAVRGNMTPLSAPRESEAAPARIQPAQSLATVRSARTAPERIPEATPQGTPALPLQSDRPQATSLADAGRVATATSAKALPAVSEAIAATSSTPGRSEAITMNIGGRLMRVEPSPHTTALKPAPLSSRDIVTAYRQGQQAHAAPAAPRPSTTIAAPRDAMTRVSQHSIAASDSIRVLQQPRKQAPTVSATLTAVTPTAQRDVVNVGHAPSAIPMARTGEVARAQTVTDVHAFSQGRLAMARSAEAMQPARPEYASAVGLPETPRRSATALESTPAPQAMSTTEPTPRRGALPGLSNARHSDPHGQTGTRAVAVTGQQRLIATSPSAQRADAAAAAAEPRNIQVSRGRGSAARRRTLPSRNATAMPQTIPLPATRTAASTWAPESPTMEARSTAIETSADTTASSPRAQPIERLSMRIAKVAPQSPAGGARAANTPARTTTPQTLRIVRHERRSPDALLPEQGIPPPRTTLVGETATRDAKGSRLPVHLSAPSVLTAPDVATTISDRLTTPGSAMATKWSPAQHGIPASTQAMLRESRPRQSAPTESPSRKARSGERAFSVSRSGRRDMTETSRSVPRTGGMLSRPKLAERSHDRASLELGTRDRNSHADVDAAIANDARDSVRSLIAAEVAASRESPSKKAIYQLRSPDKRKQLIETLGGTVDTESAVEEALDWLAASQSKNGRWDVDDFEGADECGGRGNQANADVGITGFTLLSFLGAGYTHVGGKHQETVRKALDWIMGGIGPDGDLRQGGQMYDQAMATTALCEALSLTGDSRLKPVAERAVQFILDAQNPEAAWRYNPRDDNDTSVTGWQILALKSAELAGIKVPPQHYRWTELWLDQVRSGEAGGLYLYRAGHAVTPVMTAEGWFCQIFMGAQSKSRGQQESNDYIMQHLPVWSEDIPGAINFYYWYYATLALHLSGSESFDVWNAALTSALLKGRVTEGPAAGTWDPVSHIGVRGGRVYSTAVATLCLEVYYRFLPFYKPQQDR